MKSIRGKLLKIMQSIVSLLQFIYLLEINNNFTDNYIKDFNTLKNHINL